MERERAQYHAQTIGNGLLVAAGIATVTGAIAIWRLALDVDDRFGFGTANGPGLDDYIIVLFGYVAALVTAVGILSVGGLYFRWLAIEQDAKMVEFDMLLDALGVPVDDGGDSLPEDVAPNA
jgi:hypothetical protein